MEDGIDTFIGALILACAMMAIVFDEWIVAVISSITVAMIVYMKELSK